MSVSCLRSRSHSAGRLSDVLLMAAFGPGGLVGGDRGSTENLNFDPAGRSPDYNRTATCDVVSS